MTDQLIAVVDGARARFFATGGRKTPRGEEKKKLDEIETLINPAHRVKDADMFSDLRPGSRRASVGGAAHGFDDKRDAHAEEFDRKFAQLVLEKLAHLVADNHAKAVILAAGPRMLGHLRDQRVSMPDGVVVGEFPKQLTDLSAHELCLRLQADDLI